MSENLRNYTKAVYTLDAVVKRVPADAWGNASPCESWSAREVLGHVMWSASNLASGLTGGGRIPDQSEAEVAGPDPVSKWAVTRDAVLAALDHPGALQEVADGPFGPMPVDGLLQIMTMDLLMHSWDIGEACGLTAHLPEDLAAAGTAAIAGMGEMVRRPGVFAAAVEPAADATVEDRFAAMCGRSKLR